MNNFNIGMAQQLFGIMRGGGNPLQMVQRMCGADPRVSQAMRLIHGKNYQQLRNTAANMARERGMDLNQILQQMGANQPNNQ